MVDFQIAGKVALVSGGGSGMGRAIALGLARSGVDVGIGDLVPERVDGVVAEIRALGRKADGLAVDAGAAADVRRLVAHVTERLGPIDILFNCAGIYPRSAVVEMAEAEWDRVMGTNLKAVFLLSQAVLLGMIERRTGRIVSITSSLGTTGSPRGAHYAASKAGINALTRSLAKEVADYGINVNAMAPGLTDTPMMRGSNSSEYIDSLAKSMPGGRLGQPDDVVGTALFLVSTGAQYITGQVFNLRG